MKNNRLTKDEVVMLWDVVERIRELSSMERASFACGDIEKDAVIREGVRPYMSWFNVEAYKIEKILNSNLK